MESTSVISPIFPATLQHTLITWGLFFTWTSFPQAIQIFFLYRLGHSHLVTFVRWWHVSNLYDISQIEIHKLTEHTTTLLEKVRNCTHIEQDSELLNIITNQNHVIRGAFMCQKKYSWQQWSPKQCDIFLVEAEECDGKKETILLETPPPAS